MQKITLSLRKMMTSLINNEVNYSINAIDQDLAITPNMSIEIQDTGRRYCVSCNRSVSRLFAQGFCYPCFQNSPENSECIIRPELCQAHHGKGRDPEWETRNHNQPHHVYLANSGGLKVGVTRSTQVPTRWMDQGASEAVILANTPNRYLAGIIEVHFKSLLSDKTNWQRMLKGLDPSLDLQAIYTDIQTQMPEEWKNYLATDYVYQQLIYPVIEYPLKVKSIKLDTSPSISGELIGIRGQYLIFKDNRVLNIRNHSSYEVELTVHS